jgi:hypothetical protein
MLGYPKDSKPSIRWKHIDGPLLICSNGAVHWLTLYERLCLVFNCTTIEKLNAQQLLRSGKK